MFEPTTRRNLQDKISTFDTLILSSSPPAPPVAFTPVQSCCLPAVATFIFFSKIAQSFSSGFGAFKDSKSRQGRKTSAVPHGTKNSSHVLPSHKWLGHFQNCRESQRDSNPSARVARHELRRVSIQTQTKFTAPAN